MKSDEKLKEEIKDILSKPATISTLRNCVTDVSEEDLVKIILKANSIASKFSKNPLKLKEVCVYSYPNNKFVINRFNIQEILFNGIFTYIRLNIFYIILIFLVYGGLEVGSLLFPIKHYTNWFYSFYEKHKIVFFFVYVIAYFVIRKYFPSNIINLTVEEEFYIETFNKEQMASFDSVTNEQLGDIPFNAYFKTNGFPRNRTDLAKAWLTHLSMEKNKNFTESSQTFTKSFLDTTAVISPTGPTPDSPVSLLNELPLNENKNKKREKNTRTNKTKGKKRDTSGRKRITQKIILKKKKTAV